jgi:molecular chaperone GrpE (heat shock protein)
MSEQAEIKALRGEIAQLREDVLKTRAEIDAVDDWANGIHVLLVQVLPPLIRGHVNEPKMRQALQRCDDNFERLIAHPQQAEDHHEKAGLYESAKMLNRLLLLIDQGTEQPAARRRGEA